MGERQWLEEGPRTADLEARVAELEAVLRKAQEHLSGLRYRPVGLLDEISDALKGSA